MDATVSIRQSELSSRQANAWNELLDMLIERAGGKAGFKREDIEPWLLNPKEKIWTIQHS